MLYKAFVSYSHAADGKLGPSLQSALHRFARPWYRIRAIRVFRDDTNLSVSPGLWSSIEKALGDSEFLILLASPAAATSKWVNREVDYWLKNKSAETLLLVVTDGKITWDDEAGDFDWRVTDSLPENLKKIFLEEPNYTDLRWARTAEGLSLKNPVFLNNVADLAARLHRKDKDALIGEDVRQHRKVKRLMWSAITTLIVLTLFSVGAAWFAWLQKNQAEHQRQIAVARHLAARAELLKTEAANLLPRIVLLATESYRRFPSSETYQILRSGLDLLPHALKSVRYENETKFVALSPNGLFLATRHADTIRLWSLASGNATGKPVLYSGNIYHSALTRDGSYLAISELDGFHIWNARTGDGASERVGDKCKHAAGAIGFSADGEYVASLIGDGSTVQVRRVTDGSILSKPMTHKGCVYALAFSPDARHLATYSLEEREIVWVWDSAGNVEKQLIVPHWEVSMIAFSQDGKYLASASPDRSARVWEWRTGKEIAIAQHNEAVRSVAFSPDGNFLATSSHDKTARVWEISRGREIARVAKEDGVAAAEFSADGRHLVTVGFDGTTEEWDIHSPLEVKRLEHGMHSGPFIISLSAGSPYLTIMSSDHTVQLWEVASETRVLFKRDVWAAALSPNGNLLATAAQNGSIQIWEIPSGNAVGAATAPVGRVNTITFSPDGTRFASAGDDESVRIWDTSTAQQIKTFASGSPVVRATFDRSGKRLISLTKNGVLHEWHVEGEAPARSGLSLISPADRHVSSISPDGRYVAMWKRGEKTFQVWDVSTGKSFVRLPFRSEAERAEPGFSFSPDGKYLAAATRRTGKFKWEGNITTVWEVTTGLELAHIPSYDDVNDLAFSPDGKYLATVGFGGASLWLWHPADLITEACTRLTRNLTREEWRQYLGDEPYYKTCPNLPGPEP